MGQILIQAKSPDGVLSLSLGQMNKQ